MNSNLPALKGRYSSLGVQSDIQVGILLSKSKPKITVDYEESSNNNNSIKDDNIFSKKVSPAKAELKAKTIKITQMIHNADAQNAYENTIKSLKIVTSPIRKLPTRNNNNGHTSGNTYNTFNKTKANLKHGTFVRSFSQSHDLSGAQGSRIAQAIVPSKRSTPSSSSSSRSGSITGTSSNYNNNSSTSTFSCMKSVRRVRTSHGYSSTSSSLYGNDNNNHVRPPPSPTKPSQSEIESWRSAAQDRLAKSTEKLKKQKLRDKNLLEGNSTGRRGENYSDKALATQRKRAEIYAINALLKKAEQERYKAYRNAHAPLDTDDDDDGTDSDDSGSMGYDEGGTSTPVASPAKERDRSDGVQSPMRNGNCHSTSSPAPSPFRMNVNVHL